MHRSTQTIHQAEQASRVTQRQFHHTCFACGSETLRGLQLRFQQDGHSISGTTTISDSFQSYEGIAHGGIVTTLLDAAMVRCLHNVYQREPFTCRLDVRFRRSVPTNVPIDIKAHIVSRRINRCMVDGEILYGNTHLARASGVFILR